MYRPFSDIYTMKIDINNTLRENTGHKPILLFINRIRWRYVREHPMLHTGVLDLICYHCLSPWCPTKSMIYTNLTFALLVLHFSYESSQPLCTMNSGTKLQLYAELDSSLVVIISLSFGKLIFGIIIFRCSLRFVEHVKQLIHFNNLTNLLKRKHHINWLDTDSRNER